MKINGHDVDANGLVRDGVARVEDPNPRQIVACIEWISKRAKPRKTINARLSSYGLKHRVENWTAESGPHTQVDHRGREWVGSRLYISNGAFIVAAILCGYRVKADAPNAYFNMGAQ